ncbi:MAG: outer membrane protein assembly factor BamD [Chitinophagales bacterium]
MIKKGFSFFLLAAILMASVSCNREYNKVVKSNDMESKLERAKQYYNEGDCFKAIPLFEELIAYYKGSKDLEDVYYSYAYCQYAQKDYIIASYHFKRFSELYPRSEKVEDAAFMVAKCNHEQSPKFNLDQTPTYKAIAQYQAFTQKYPNSDKISEVNAAIDELRLKLHKKAYAGARLYFRLKDYQAAATSFKTLVETYPESKDAEESYYYVVLSSKLLADNSYASKKLERYEQTVVEFNMFKQKFPNSKYLNELEEINKNSLKSIESIKQQSTENGSKNERRS